MLKWSFGAMHGRTTDLWQKQTSSLIVPEMLKELIEKGFTGLYIDRDGYADGGQAIEAHLSQLLKIMPHVDNHRSFWDLRELR
jgi:phosphoglycerol transferase